MSTWGVPSAIDLWWSTRRSRLLLFAIHVPFLLVPALLTATGLEGPAESVWIVAALTIAIAAVALRHSFAAAEGGLPAWWPMTLTVLALLTLLPLHWFGDDWASMQWILIASAALLLSGWLRLICVLGPMVGIPVWTTLQSVSQHGTLTTDVYIFVYYFVGLAGGFACLYGATHLVRAVDELFATRAELATSMIGREHGRLSRDLHDLLGQSLSAVSLKGDLALALLRGGSRSEAEKEIQSLTHLARQALHDIRHVVRDRHSVSLHTETQGARALLAAAGIDATIDAQLENLPGPIDELLGWATREGVTNMLRHSEASSCSIRAIRRAGTVVLEIINDRADTGSEPGTGIAGLAERARALAGSVSAGDTGDGRYRLMVQVPEPEPRR